jgi:predicted NodU family carbamoyl transferase
MILGITAQNHDASMALIDGDRIVWAGHSERYSRQKNDKLIHPDMVDEMFEHGFPTEAVWFAKVAKQNPLIVCQSLTLPSIPPVAKMTPPLPCVLAELKVSIKSAELEATLPEFSE